MRALKQGAQFLMLLFLLVLPVAKGATLYQEIGWEALIPEAERIQNVDAFLNQQTSRPPHRPQAPINPALQGQSILLRGFVVPLEREQATHALREFLLVPYFGACIHTPPPPANQIIHVRAEQGAADIKAMTPVTVYGRLTVEASATQAGNAAYQLQADKVEALRSEGSLVFPILLTLFCGLSAGMGAFAALLIPRTEVRIVCLGLAFAAGIMLWLGLSPLYLADDTAFLFAANSGWQTFAWFLAGILLAGTLEWRFCRKQPSGATHRAGEFSALAVAAHGFPESLAIFSAALMNPATGILLSSAVMAHHLPLGLAIALPLKQKGSRRPITYALLAGLLPAIVVILLYLLVRPLFSPANLGLFFALAGGIMVFIAAVKLIPSARSYGNLRTLLAGLMAGLLFAALSLHFLE